MNCVKMHLYKQFMLLENAETIRFGQKNTIRPDRIKNKELWPLFWVFYSAKAESYEWKNTLNYTIRPMPCVLCFLFGQKWCVIKKKIHSSANWSDFFLFLNWLVAECDIILRPKNIFNLATTILKEGEGRRIAANNSVSNSQKSST